MRRDKTGIRCRPLPGEEGYGCFFIGSLIGAGAQILGGILGEDEAEGAEDIYREGRQVSTAELNRLLQEQRDLMQPFVGGSGMAMSALLAGVGPGMYGQGELTRGFTEEDFREDPGYQYRLAEGEKAINKAAAARGQFMNPQTVRELMTHSQGLADQTYNDAFNRFQTEQANRYNRLMGLVGITQRGSEQLMGAAQVRGNQEVAASVPMVQGLAGANLAGGNALVSGLTGAGATLGEGLTMNQYANRLGAVTPATPATPVYATY